MPVMTSDANLVKELSEAPPVFVQKLERPVFSMKGEMVDELRFREPTAGDILRCGNPVRYDPRFDPPRIEFNEEAAFEMIAALTNVPSAMLSRLTPNDIVASMWAITRYFIPGLSTKPVEQPAN